MLSKMDVYIKCIMLLYTESELISGNHITQVEGSSVLIKSVIKVTDTEKKVILGGDTIIIEDLKNLLLDMLNNPDSFSKDTLIQSLSVILRDKTSTIKTLETFFTRDISVPGMKKFISNLKVQLNNYYKDKEIIATISRASYELNTGKATDKLQEYVSGLIKNLENLSKIENSIKDPAIVDELDIGETEKIVSVAENVKKFKNSGNRYKTGWSGLNTMLNGGFIPGETVLTSALQHNYKSGFVRSLFAQICMYNTPELMDSSKKPLNVFISLEDNADVSIAFFYEYLYNAEYGKLPDTANTSAEVISNYIKEKLTATGFNIKFLRVDPSNWDYRKLVNKILQYEINGFEVKTLVVDYLGKLPTIGCDNSGPMGTAHRDLLDRMRQFTTQRKILFITPWQLSTEAKELIKNRIEPTEFVKVIANKGYYEGCKQLDHIVDLELHHHVVNVAGKYYLTVQRGKRRYPEIIADKKKYIMLPFPHESPIKPNIDTNGNPIDDNVLTDIPLENTTPIDNSSDDPFDNLNLD